jgi:hypothetical protein
MIIWFQIRIKRELSDEFIKIFKPDSFSKTFNFFLKIKRM